MLHAKARAGRQSPNTAGCSGRRWADCQEFRRIAARRRAARGAPQARVPLAWCSSSSPSRRTSPLSRRACSKSPVRAPSRCAGSFRSARSLGARRSACHKGSPSRTARCRRLCRPSRSPAWASRSADGPPAPRCRAETSSLAAPTSRAAACLASWRAPQPTRSPPHYKSR